MASSPRVTTDRGDQSHRPPALPGERADQTGIPHRIERMIFERAFIKTVEPDKQMPQIDRAPGFRKGRRDEDRSAVMGVLQGFSDWTDIAVVGRIEGRAHLEHRMTCAVVA